jgi:hypothetical protein
LDVRLFHGLNTPIVGLILTVQAAHAGLLIWIAWRLFSRVFLMFAAVILWLSFSPLQLESFFWPAQIGSVLVWASASAAFLLLGTFRAADLKFARQTAGKPVVLGTCLLSAAISTLSSPNGVFVWPVLILQAWVIGLSIRVRMLLTTAGVVMAGAYFWHYEAGPPMGMGAFKALLHPEQSIPVLGMLVAGVITPLSIHAAMIIGCVALALALYILIKVLWYGPPPLLTVYSGLALLALLTLASVVANRISPEFIAEREHLHLLVIPSRYYTTLSFLWAGVAGVSIWMATKNRREWPQLAAAGAMAFALTIGTIAWQIGEAANWRGYFRELDVAGSALIMHVNDPSNSALAEIYPESPLRRNISAWLEKDKLALFSERRAILPGQRVTAADPENGHCRGEAQTVASVNDGVLRITGWALDTRTGRPPQDLVFVDPSGTIVGVARSGRRRPDLKAKLGEQSLDTIGWQGYARGAGEALVVYGVLDGAGHYCRVGQPVFLPNSLFNFLPSTVK